MKTPLSCCLAAAVALVAMAYTAQAEPTAMDVKFAKGAAIGGMFEVKSGEVAVKNAKSPEVKSFGEMMVTQHGEADAKLAAIAKEDKIDLPTQLDDKRQAKLDDLSKLQGAAFDKAYVDAMVMGHTETLSKFKMASSVVKDPQLLAFLQETIPVVEHHLTVIKGIQASMK